MEDEFINADIELDFDDKAHDISELRKAFEKQGGFQSLSERIQGKISLKLTFSNSSAKSKYRKKLMDHGNANLEGFAMYGFNDENALEASVEYDGTMDTALSVASDLYSLTIERPQTEGMEAVKETVTKNKNVAFDPQETIEDEQVVRAFYKWVTARMGKAIHLN